jgi:hypothetical protein
VHVDAAVPPPSTLPAAAPSLLRRLKKGKTPVAAAAVADAAPAGLAAPRLVRRVGTVAGVVPPDELCSPAAAKLMHAMLEIRLVRAPGPPAALPTDAVDRGAEKDGDGDGDDDDDDADAPLCLVPLVPSIVAHVDVARRLLVLTPPAGLLDLTYVEKKKTAALRGFLPEVAAPYMSAADKRALYVATAGSWAT